MLALMLRLVSFRFVDKWTIVTAVNFQWDERKAKAVMIFIV